MDREPKPLQLEYASPVGERPNSGSVFKGIGGILLGLIFLPVGAFCMIFAAIFLFGHLGEETIFARITYFIMAVASLFAGLVFFWIARMFFKDSAKLLTGKDGEGG